MPGFIKDYIRKWQRAYGENKWIVLSFIIPAIVAPVVASAAAEGIKYAKKKIEEKKQKR